MIKNASILFRATSSEVEITRKLAARYCLTVSEYIRYLIRRDAEKQNLWPPAQEEAQRETV